MKSPFVLASLASLALLPACLVPDPGDASVAPELRDYRQSGGFLRADRAPYDSDLADDILIDCWISAAAASEYARVAPEQEGSGAHLPEGTMIVREVHERRSGAITKLTVMGKGAAGSSPSTGDWWYAVTDTSGVPLAGDDGAPLVGALAVCRDCHVKRAGDDFVFGVPFDQR